jgi:hypothetical protein
VYYDPNKPSEAVLERSAPGFVPWLWVALILLDVFLCGGGAAMLWAFS